MLRTLVLTAIVAAAPCSAWADVILRYDARLAPFYDDSPPIDRPMSVLFTISDEAAARGSLTYKFVTGRLDDNDGLLGLDLGGYGLPLGDGDVLALNFTRTGDVWGGALFFIADRLGLARNLVIEPDFAHWGADGTAHDLFGCNNDADGCRVVDGHFTVPEPRSLALLLIALGGLAAVRRTR